jgi:hypothetical protein
MVTSVPMPVPVVPVMLVVVSIIVMIVVVIHVASRVWGVVIPRLWIHVYRFGFVVIHG